MVGRLTEDRRHQLVDLLWAIVRRRSNKAAAILRLWADAEDMNEDALAVEIDDFIDQVHGVPLKQLDLPRMIADLMALMRRFDLVLPSDLTLLSKAFITLEGMGRQLAPEFDMISAAEPFLRRVVLERYEPAALIRRGHEDLSDALELAAKLPQELQSLVQTVRKGRLALRVDLDHGDRYLSLIVRAVGLLTMGIVIAALIVGSSIVMTAAGGEIPFGLSAFAMMGFAVAVAGGFWLLISLWRNR
jgi:ubiquinone biosynthesis protein